MIARKLLDRSISNCLRRSSVKKLMIRWWDDEVLRLMHEFDRVLNRDDVASGGAIAVIDHRGERSRLARPGGPRPLALVHDRIGACSSLRLAIPSLEIF